MRARSASFLVSASAAAGFPPPTVPEIAFAGRSNVGKSSLINSLTAVKGLARTSATPGRTRLVNWFRVTPPSGPELAFVDLPGYGYAKVSKDLRAAWRPLIEQCLLRPTIKMVIMIVDARRGAEEEERDLLEWLDSVPREALVVLTKGDKLPKAKRFPAAMAAKRELGLARTPIVFSAVEGEGVGELWRAVLAAV